MGKNLKPLILLTNDDGISAPGIAALYDAIADMGEISVIAPDSERSAVGHAITLSDPIRVNDFNRNGKFMGKAVSGTPADCVKIAVSALLPRKPDLILSGINLGANTGINVIYSGTVSAATEGAIFGIPSIAVSLATYTQPDFRYTAKFARRLAQTVLNEKIPEGTLLNVNVPNIPENEIKGVRITKQGKALFAEEFEKRTDPRNRVYYWMSGTKIDQREEDDADDEVIKHGYVSITPIQIDMTNYDFMKELSQWSFAKELSPISRNSTTPS